MKMLRLPRSFRRRLALAAALGGAIAIALASLIAYVTVRERMYEQIDNSLRVSAATSLTGDRLLFTADDKVSRARQARSRARVERREPMPLAPPTAPDD